MPNTASSIVQSPKANSNQDQKRAQREDSLGSTGCLGLRYSALFVAVDPAAVAAVAAVVAVAVAIAATKDHSVLSLTLKVRPLRVSLTSADAMFCGIVVKLALRLEIE